MTIREGRALPWRPKSGGQLGGQGRLENIPGTRHLIGSLCHMTVIFILLYIRFYLIATGKTSVELHPELQRTSHKKGKLFSGSLQEGLTSKAWFISF